MTVIIKYRNHNKKEVIDKIHECLENLCHIYFKEWLTTKEIQDYIMQEMEIFIKRVTIANIIRLHTSGIERDKLRYRDMYFNYGHTFIKYTLGISYDSNVYRRMN